MAHVKQVCQGYNKKTLIGNWYQERLYPNQPFRENLDKKARNKDQDITTFDGTGFQRALPRLQRRTKWQTKDRIILNDGINFQHSEAKGSYPHLQHQITNNTITKPLDKNLEKVTSTDNHPHSQVRPKQKSYHYLNQTNVNQQKVTRDAIMYGSDFKSTLPIHPQTLKQKRYGSTYNKSFGKVTGDQLERTNSQFVQSRKQAGNFLGTTQQKVKPITTMVCELKKQVGDEKQRTATQRSWVHHGDKCLSYSVGKKSNHFTNNSTVKNDIQTSLNMNIGIHNLHPKLPQDGYFKHLRTITVPQNKTFCPRP